MARLSIHVLIDTSGSMRGESMAASLNGLHSLLVALRSMPDAEHVDLCCTTFDRELTMLQAMCPLSQFIPPVGLETRNAPSHLGNALRLLSLNNWTEPGVATNPNLVFIFTDGPPTDLHAFRLFCKDRGVLQPARLVIFIPNPSCEQETLRQLSHEIIALDTASPFTFRQILHPSHEPASDPAPSGQAKPDNGHLPPPPPEFNLVI